MKENIGVYRGIFIYTGIVAGMMVPIQTSINSRLGRYTESSFMHLPFHFRRYTIFIYFKYDFNPKLFDGSFYSGHTIDYHWWVGGLLGVCFLTGNLLLLPRLGAALTVVMTVAGQIIMGVFIDTFGLLGASNHSFTFLKAVGIIILFFGILLMNYIPKNKLQEKQIICFMFGLSSALYLGLRHHYKQQLTVV